MLDLVLAIAHHLLVFAVLGALLAEFLALRALTSSAAVARIATVDLGFGILATLVVIVGFSRAAFAAKGWLYYSHNAFFWAKMATFAALGLLSIVPTMAIVRWRRSGTVPDDAAIEPIRRYLHIELGLFVFLPIFAAAMARGYGEF
jgi:putative membrane protein